jgi:PTS system mannose-specific IID component
MAEKKVSKRALNKACTLWLEFANAGYSWIRLMGNSYAMMMVPIAHDLYPDDKEARNAMIARSMDFYNTEPNCGNVINGIAISMEEKIANREEAITGDDILTIRTALMGPLAGIGDTILNVLNTIFLAICIDMTVSGSWLMGPILYLLLRLGSVHLLGRWSFWYGYRKGGEAVMDAINSGKFSQVVTIANIVGCVVMGALMCQYVKVQTGLKVVTQNTTFEFQSKLFDALMPNLLPLVFTLFCWWLITKKRVSVNRLLVYIIAIAAVLGGLKILV